MGYRDQLTRLFKTRIADGVPLQHIRKEFADGLHGLLVGADMFRLHMLMARCPTCDSAATSNYPPGLIFRPDDTPPEVTFPLDPVYAVLLSTDPGIAALREGVRESQLLGAYAAWHFVDLCDLLDQGTQPLDLGAVDDLMQCIHLAIVRGSERTMEQHIEDALGEADLKRVEALRDQSRSLAKRRWLRTTQDRALAVQIGLRLQASERYRSDAARRVIRELQKRSGGAYEQKTVDKWLKEAGWKSAAGKS